MDPNTKPVNTSNPFVYFDIGIGKNKGRVVFELFADGQCVLVVVEF